MNREIIIDRILVYYDLPQIFIGRDLVNTIYLCVYTESTQKFDKYISVQISSDRLYKLLSGNIDLKNVLINSEVPQKYIIHIDDACYIFSEIDQFDDDDLPEEGYYLHIDLDDDIDKEVIYFNKPIFHLGIVDINSAPSADIEELSQVLHSFQGLYSNIVSKLGYRNQSKSLRVFTSSAASYNLHLYVNTELDLFGYSPVDSVFSTINGLFQYKDEEELVDNLRKLKGYPFSYYKTLIKSLIDNKLSIKYKYKTPSSENTLHSNSVSCEQINRINELLQQNSELNAKNITLHGFFSAVSTDNLSWTFKSSNDGSEDIKTYKGKTDNAELLNGVIIANKEYEIICEVKLKTDEVTKKQQTIYELDDLSGLP